MPKYSNLKRRNRVAFSISKYGNPFGWRVYLIVAWLAGGLPVFEDGIDHFNVHELLFSLFFPVVAKLACPIEIVDTRGSDFQQVDNRILRMHVEHDKSSEGESCEGREIRSYEFDDVFQLLIQELQVFL